MSMNGFDIINQKKLKIENRKKEVENQVYESSEKNHRFFLVYIFLLTYVLIIVSSTTDLQLLLEERGIILPLLNIHVSLVGFYIIAPLLILFIHVNLILHASITCRKLINLNGIYNSLVPDIKIKNNILDIAILSNNNFHSKTYKALANILYIYAAPIVLSVTFFRFSDYQSTTIFSLHLAILSIDLACIIIFSKSFNKKFSSARSSNERPSSILLPFGYNRILDYLVHAFILFIIIKAVVCWDVFIRDWGDSFSKNIIYHYYNDTDDDGSINDFYGLLPIIKIDRTTQIAKSEDSKFFGTNTLMKDSSSLHNFITRGMSVDLRNRSLRYAALPMQNLPRVWLTNSELQGANLLFSQLQGVVLSNTKLQGANLSGSTLDGAYIFNSNLINTNLSHAKIRGATISDSNFSFANLNHSDMSFSAFAGNLLYLTNFIGANLNSSFLAENKSYNALFGEKQIIIYDINFNEIPFIINTPSQKEKELTSKEISPSGARYLFLDAMELNNNKNPNNLIFKDNKKTDYNIMSGICKKRKNLNDNIVADYLFQKIILMDFELSKNVFSYLKNKEQCSNIISYLEENNLEPQGSS
ncbi:pentapeptide repeat-containing protein [Pectobacterium carotovorum]|uniref:pentapeptide repeat-containing protein n=1 Tax=Pectobacterium carotovorum TaxID=554 RepID=UPI002B240DF5|nr:pentapeptide repeat-containing protein [Pectobacterium carotovorum]